MEETEIFQMFQEIFQVHLKIQDCKTATDDATSVKILCSKIFHFRLCEQHKCLAKGPLLFISIRV